MNTSDMIKMLCHHNKITVAELARRIGQSSQNLTQKIKRGTVSMDEMASIAAAVNSDYSQSFVMPNREVISLHAMSTGAQMTVDERTTGRNLDIMLIPQIFTAVYYVDLEEDKATIIYQDKWIEEQSKNFISASEAIVAWVNNSVCEEDREKILKKIHPSAIKKLIKDKNKYSEFYRSIHTTEKEYQEVLVVKGSTNDNRYAYICYINRKDDIKLTEQQTIYKRNMEFSSSVLWSAVEEVYQNCYICNLSANEYRQVQAGMHGESFEVSDGKYDDFIQHLQQYITDEKERQHFGSTFDRESLLKVTESGHTKIYCEYSMINEHGEESRMAMRCLLRKDVFDNDIAVLLLSDVSEEYEKDKRIGELSKEDQDYMDILFTFTRKFVAVYKINLDNDTYEILKYNERSKGLIELFKKSGNCYSKNSKLFIENSVHPEDREAVYSTASLENLRNALKEKENLVSVYRDIANGKPEYFEMHAISHHSNWGGNYAIMIFSNADKRITEQMEYQRNLKEALVEANAAIEAKKKFLFNMSHDIRTPMNAILGFAQIAMMNSSASPKLKECLDKIQQAGDSLLQILNDVLEMSNLESGGVELDEQVVHSESIGKGIVSMIQQAAFKKNIRFSYIVSNVLDEEVYCDVNHVNQILINLLTNAINFTHEGGKVHYTIEQLESVEEDKVNFCFTIEDTGIGISKDFIEHIFEPFSKEHTSTESGIEGTGLGLSIAKRLAEVMGGHIEVESALEKGSVFRFYAKFRRKGIINRRFEMDKKEKPVKTVRVLVADDDRLNREVIKKMLGVIDIESDEVENGQQVLEKMKSVDNNYYTAILMDIQMPVLNGYDTTVAIRSLSDHVLSEIPIVAMTANERSSDMKKCFAVGMNDFITKPINMKSLISVMEHITNSNV